MSASVFRTAATGTGAIATAVAVAVGQTYRVVSVTLHINTAATTSENLTITLNATNGAAYDTLLYSVNPATSALLNLVWQPAVPLYLIGGDSLDIAWTNTEGRTYGLLVTMEGVA